MWINQRKNKMKKGADHKPTVMVSPFKNIYPANLCRVKMLVTFAVIDVPDRYAL